MIWQEKLKAIVPKLRTRILESESDYSVEVYDESSTKIVFRCLCSKERYSLYDVHVLLSKVLL